MPYFIEAEKNFRKAADTFLDAFADSGIGPAEAYDRMEEIISELTENK